MPVSIRRRLIASLKDANGAYLSGQTLADALGCSRTAVWKHIEELREEGYAIEAVRKKGYKLLFSPDRLKEEEITHDLQTKRLGKSVRYHETVTSTQTVAHELAQNGAPEGMLVIAEEQTGGRGRMARRWHSRKQKGIWMSLIIRPRLQPQQAPQFTLIAAVAIVKAIEDVTGISAAIKWPNDILLNGKKITGILTEMSGEADHIHFLVIGVGMNINQEEDDFPPEVRNIATSLFLESGHKVDRAEIVRHFLRYFEKYYDLYIEKGFTPIKLIWESYAASIGKRITARTIRGEITGRAMGITEEGVLLIEDDEGEIHRIYSADIDMN